VYSISQVQPNLATLNPDLTVFVEPIKDVHITSIYTLSLVGLLEDYNMFAQVEFLVQVTVCEAEFDVSSLQLPLLYTVWYGQEQVVDLANYMADIRQVPDCCHPLSFKAYWSDPVLPNDLSPLPLEIKFSNNVFFIKKCNPLGAFISGDAECNDATVPYIKNYNLVLEVTMEDGGPIQNLRTTYLNMGAMVDDPCQYDTLSFYNL